MGIFRQIGKVLINFKQDDAALNDLFALFIQAGASPHSRELMVSLLNTDSKHEILWHGIEQLQIFTHVYEKSEFQGPWNQLIKGAQSLKESPAYQKLKIGDALQPLLRFLEQRDVAGNPTSPEDQALSQKFVHYGARLLNEQDLEQFLVLSKTEPESFYQTLETLADTLSSPKNPKGSQPFRDFMAMVRRSLAH